MRVIDREALETTMLAELRAAWASLRGRHPCERFYSFGLYTTDLADYLMVTASTEEGLSEVTQRYVTQTGRDATALRATLRWSPPDSPLLDSHIRNVTRHHPRSQTGARPERCRL